MSRHKKIVEFAPAKINLFLKVLRKRPDGYHDIETLFERIGIFDKITVSVAEKKGICIKCDNPDIPTGKGSLSYRTAELLMGDRPKGVKISIQKKIPVAAGLGGGSSDSASILKALNRLLNLKFTKNQLMEKARLLGSDVAFFVSQCSFAIGTERGDSINPVKPAKKFWHLIVYPNIKMLSGDIYRIYSQAHSLGLTTKKRIDRILSPAVSDTGDISRLKAILYNDLESIVLSRESIIKNIKNTLESHGADKALVSGSGPSVFGLYKTRKEAEVAEKSFLKHFTKAEECRTFVARTF